MSDGDQPPEWTRHVEWITILAQNIMAAANDLRPIQVIVSMLAMFIPFLICYHFTGSRKPGAHDETAVGITQGGNQSYTRVRQSFRYASHFPSCLVGNVMLSKRCSTTCVSLRRRPINLATSP